MSEFFNSRVCLSASSETRFKTTQNFKNTRFLFCFDSTNITIRFVVIDDKFYMLIFIGFFSNLVCTLVPVLKHVSKPHKILKMLDFYFISIRHITIRFVVVDDKFYMLKFIHIANAIVDACRRRIAEFFAFFVLFKIRKNAFSFVVFWTNKILSSTSLFRHRSYFCS